MPAAQMKEIVGPAAAAGRGVGAFNVIGIEHAEAIVAGAEAAGAPVVLQVSQNCVAYHGALDPLGRACATIAGSAAVPVALHLDHATSMELVREAAGLGFGKDGVHSPHARTDPDDAARYVDATGVDALAVAVGTSHAMLTRDAVLDTGLIARIHGVVSVPLVLHGSSGVPDAALAAAIGAGMTKINVATQLNKAFTAAVRDCLAADSSLVDPRRYGAAGRDAIAIEVARLLRVIGAGIVSQDESPRLP